MNVNKANIFPADMGEKVVIFGAVTEDYRPTILDMNWITCEARWQIVLLWESGEHSVVYSTDKNKSWTTETDYLISKDQRILN